MASNTQIKIRYGLILQAVLARALTGAGYSYAETPAYDPDSEVPDFLIPDAENPEFVMEVHQTDARDHFRMKTLRSLTAVAEAKAFFGPDVVSVNVLFGDPDAEVPEANLRAMCGIFDMNLLLQRDATEDEVAALRQLESEALDLAGQVAIPTNTATNQLVGSHPEGVTAMGRLLDETLSNGVIKEELRPMWEAEESRRTALGEPPEPGESTFYKKNMIRSLFFTDAHFAAMAVAASPDDWPESAKQQAVLTGIAEIEEEIDGDHLIVEPEFLAFTTHADTPRLRQMCSDVLVANDTMRLFFEDIRDGERRRRMVETFLAHALSGNLRSLIELNINGITVSGIEHCRNWGVDVATRCLEISNNRLSRLIFTDFQNVAALGDPISHIAPNTARFRGLNDQAKSAYVDDILGAVEHLRNEDTIEWGSIDVDSVSDSLLNLRILGAMRLRTLDALPLMAEAIASIVGFQFDKVRVTSVLSDLADEPAVGRFELFEIALDTTEGGRVLINLVATEGNPRDKAKEWGARRLATLYRYLETGVEGSPYQHAIFVLDGTWAQSDVTRLYRCGWDYVVRMGDLEETLRCVFEIPAIGPGAVTPLPDIPDEDDDLPMAAEEE